MNLNPEARTHYLVSFIGGFLGIFPIVNASHFLGSAQTSNLIDILLGFIYGNGRSVLFHAGGAFLYAFAVFLVTFPGRKKSSGYALSLPHIFCAGLSVVLV